MAVFRSVGKGCGMPAALGEHFGAGPNGASQRRPVTGWTVCCLMLACSCRVAFAKLVQALVEARGAAARRRRPGFAARLASAALVPAMATALAAPARAQTVETLVSNAGQTESTTNTTQRQAQLFTTGSNTQGYVLTNVDLYLRSPVNTSDGMLVRIFSVDADDEPDSVLYTLTNPSSLSSTATSTSRNNFRAPADATLLADTTYAVVVTGSNGTSAVGRRLMRTASNAEDSGEADGWSIDNNSLYRTTATGSWTSREESLRIRIRGYIPRPATGQPTISGAAQVGMTLTASTSDIMDDNGLTGATYAYQWIAVAEDGTEFEVGTDSSSYALTWTDRGEHMKVKVTFTDDLGYEESRTSEQTFLVMPALSSNCGADTFWCGVLTVGHHPDDGDGTVGFGSGYGSLDVATFTLRGVQYTITALAGTEAHQRPLFLSTTPALPADAVRNVTLHMQKYSGELSLPFSDAEFQSGSNAWVFYGALFLAPGDPLSDQPLLKPYSRPGADRLSGATDIGTKIAVRLSKPANTAATGKPTIGGFPRVGGVLTARRGTIADTGGLPETFPDDYDLQWVRVDDDGVSNPEDIAGATSGTYTPVAADEGKKLKVKVSFTDAEGVAEGPLESEPTSAVRDTSAPLLDTTLVVRNAGQWNRDYGCNSTSDYECDEGLDEHEFSSTDGNGDVKTFAISALVLTRSGSVNGNLNLAFVDTPLRNYETRNLVLVLDGTRFLFRYADAGGYRVRQWQNTSLNWSRGQTVQVQILDDPDAVRALRPLTASIENLPASHDGSSPFTFRLSFSDEVTIEPAAMRDHALVVNHGTVTGASRVGGRKDLWEITVQPAGNLTVSISVPHGRACTETGALCTADGRRLSQVPLRKVSGPSNQPRWGVALTASFEDVPAEHDGSSSFTLELAFSEAVFDGSESVNKNQVIEDALQVTGGTITNRRRVDPSAYDRWILRIRPSGHGDVTVRLPRTTSGCGATGAICTPDNRPLSAPTTATIQGPPGLSVADAEVQEGPNASLDFTVTLDRSASGAVSVQYATANGSAIAGSDYTATSGTLNFAAGDTEKTVSVPVIDDSHNEGDETLTLTLSNASGAWIADGEATGTIENHDPLPAAFIARFGRATAEQVVQHVEERMAAPRERGFRARFAGREFQPGMERDFALGFLSGFGPPMGASPTGGYAGGASAAGGAPMGSSTVGAHMSGHGVGGPGMAGGLAAAGGGGAAIPGHEASTGHGGGFLGSFLPGGDLFSNSEFELNREQHGGIVSVWSRSSRTHFGGAEGALSLRGDVRTTMFGADYTRGALVVGLSVGRTLGLGGYSGPSAGQMTTSMTGFYPWVGYQVNDRVSVWGVTGYGTGALNLAPDGAAVLDTGLSMAMTAAGTRGQLIGSGATGGFALAFKADALWVGASTDQVDGAAGRLSASEAGVTRVRTALEGSRGFTVGGRVSLTPSVEIGLRQDAGDAETGAGMDVGTGLVLTDAVTGLSLDVRVRTLVVHQSAGFTERGMSFSFGWDPTPSSPLGLTARLSPSWGGSTMSGAEALWHGQMAYGPGSHQLAGAGGQLDAEVGYGLPAGRFVGTPRAGFRTSEYGRDYRMGYSLGLLESRDLRLDVGVDAQRRENAQMGGADNGVLGRATIGW